MENERKTVTSSRPARYRRARPEIDVDARGRTSLAKVRSTEHTRYEVVELQRGVLVLIPLVTQRATEMPSIAELEKATAGKGG